MVRKAEQRVKKYKDKSEERTFALHQKHLKPLSVAKYFFASEFAEKYEKRVIEIIDTFQIPTLESRTFWNYCLKLASLRSQFYKTKDLLTYKYEKYKLQLSFLRCFKLNIFWHRPDPKKIAFMDIDELCKEIDKEAVLAKPIKELLFEIDKALSEAYGILPILEKAPIQISSYTLPYIFKQFLFITSAAFYPFIQHLISITSLWARVFEIALNLITITSESIAPVVYTQPKLVELIPLYEIIPVYAQPTSPEITSEYTIIPPYTQDLISISSTYSYP